VKFAGLRVVSEMVMVHPWVGHLPPGGLAGVIVERAPGVGPEPTANANRTRPTPECTNGLAGWRGGYLLRPEGRRNICSTSLTEALSATFRDAPIAHVSLRVCAQRRSALPVSIGPAQSLFPGRSSPPAKHRYSLLCGVKSEITSTPLALYDLRGRHFAG
jgi:hypothetical protein